MNYIWETALAACQSGILREEVILPLESKRLEEDI